VREADATTATSQDVSNGDIPSLSSADTNRDAHFEARWGGVGHGVVAFDNAIRVLWGNRRMGEMLGVDLDEWRGKEPYSFVHPDDRDRVLDSFGGLGSFGGRRGPAVYRLMRSDGTARQAVVSGINLLDDPDWACLVLEIRDIDEDQRAQALANDEYAILERLVHNPALSETLTDIARLVERHGDAGDCLITLLRDGVFRVATAPNISPGLADAIDGTPALPGQLTMGEALRRRSEVVSVDLLTDPLWESLRDVLSATRYRSCWTVPILSTTSEGELIGTVDFFGYHAGEPGLEEWALYVLGARLAGLAIERSEFVERLQFQATHDPLTGLLNRRALIEGLSELDGTSPRSVAVLFIDLDRFKVVNDAHGHDLGDRVLCAVADRLRSLEEDGAKVARIGGDEFVIAWPDVATPGTAIKLAERARSLVAEPIEHDVVTLVATASVGVSVGVPDHDRPEQLIQDADAALYRAKAGGRNRCVFFDDTLRAVHLRRRETERDLGRALERHELAVYFQPVVHLATGRVVAVEALARWQHPTRGLLLPTEFIDVAEDAGLIVDIDRWILANGLRQVARWNEGRATPLLLWANVSAAHLARPDTVALLHHAQSSWPSVPLGIELTESAIHHDRDGAINSIRQLRDAGLKVAIDDFGTGYSSLDALRLFPVTHLKIDKGFVTDLLTNPHDHAIVEASITLARAMDLTVTAEGIESPGHAETITALGCDHAQGFLYSRAAPAQDLEERLGRRLERSWDAVRGQWVSIGLAPRSVPQSTGSPGKRPQRGLPRSRPVS